MEGNGKEGEDEGGREGKDSKASWVEMERGPGGEKGWQGRGGDGT